MGVGLGRRGRDEFIDLSAYKSDKCKVVKNTIRSVSDMFLPPNTPSSKAKFKKSYQATMNSIGG